MKKLFLIGIALSIIACVSTQAVQKHSAYSKINKFEPPIAKKILYETSIHDTVLVDNYHWMKDKSRTDPEVIAYIEKENAYTDSVLFHTTELQEHLFQEIVGRIQETDMSVPVRIDSFHYYWKDIEGEEYSLYCRKKCIPDCKEEIVIDINELASGYEFYDVSNLEVSPDHQYIAFTFDTTGAERYTLAVKDIKEKSFLSDTAYPVDDIEWAIDGETLLYITSDETGRGNKVFTHKLGTSVEQDSLIYEESDGSFYLGIYRTKDDRWLMINTGSKISSETWLLPAVDPYMELKLVQKREPGVKYFLYSHEDGFFILTNIDGAVNYKVMTTKSENPSPDFWKEYIPARDSTKISIDIFKDYLVVYELKAGIEKIRIFDLIGETDYYVPFEDKLYSIFFSSNPMFDTDTLRFEYQSFITLPAVYDLNMKTLEKVLRKQRSIKGFYDPSLYNQERIYATALDGTKIPISLVYKKELFAKDGSNPLFLAGYGSYGDTIELYFSSTRLSLLDRGFVYAIAHIRGGGEYGKQWHEQGRMLNKKNTFTDFIACEEYLINEHYTNRDKLVIEGGSAGGMLIGAVLNMRPELCEIAIADVPFVDVINTVLDPTLSATVSEYEEWGDPKDKEYFDYIFSYCPYQNVKTQQYPHILAFGGFYDPRVNFWEPAKWIAKLREMKSDANLALLKIRFSGHVGASGRFSYYREVALKYAFVFDILGIEF